VCVCFASGFLFLLTENGEISLLRLKMERIFGLDFIFLAKVSFASGSLFLLTENGQISLLRLKMERIFVFDFFSKKFWTFSLALNRAYP
jgi:hypothetical protein